MSEHIVVLGGGPGGYVAALRAAQLGAQVSLVEEEQLGGACLNWGCIPTKTLMASAQVLDSLRRAEEFGLHVQGSIQADMPQMQSRKKRVIDTQAKGIAGLLRKQEVEVLWGRGRITPDQKLEVTSAEGQSTQLVWDKLILAVGSGIAPIPALPFDGRRIISSNDALELNEIPESMVIVGGGVIGCEFATLFSHLGCTVHIVEGLDRLLPIPGVDAECSKLVQREMKKRKIDIRLHQTAVSVEAGDHGVRVQTGPSPFAPEGKG